MKKQRMTIRFSKLRPEDIVKNKKSPQVETPQMQDERSFTGHMPDVESDDNVLEIQHTMGLALNEDEEHPKPITIASDIDKAEEYKRTH